MFDPKKFQNILSITQVPLATLDYNTSLIRLEEEYQTRIVGFSPAYLSGSDWYVGPSLRAYIDKAPLEKTVISLLGSLAIAKHTCST
jgi:hypothetical protein